ncbi:MAG: GNAT family N-acetyltransferase [Archangium sp.]|nr:GNAT family N-acetyltransferase [Archangium sp.]
MGAELIIRPLAAEDDRASFTCGQADLDRFFHHYAGHNQFKLRVSVTYVAVVGERILGFATVTPATIERERIPARKKLPAYPLPVLRLARLAVDLDARDAGIGSALLAFVLGLAKRQRDQLGGLGVVTDAKPEAVAFYEKYGFARLSDDAIVEGAITADPVAMFLSIDSIP